MRFLMFLLALILSTIVLLYIVGDQRAPQRETVEVEIELEARTEP